MSRPGILLKYAGPVDYKIIDQLLTDIKMTQEYIRLQKTIKKRVYAILEECLENISKHSVKNSQADNNKIQPFIIAGWKNDLIIINARNPVYNDKKDKLDKMLDFINQLDKVDLTHLYNEKISRQSELEFNGAGLGFILMRLKSGNKIEYHFTPIDKIFSSFEIEVSINTNTMRKLIIDQTSNSPKVTFEPDNNIFEISGESRPPDVAGFYNEILRWMEDFSLYLGKGKEIKDTIIFNLDFEYFNSSSAKYILDFCKQIGTIRSKGTDVTVKWHYEEGDTDMLEVGREMSKMAKFPFEYVQKN